MPQPTRGDVHVDRALTNVSVAYLQKSTNFISQIVFPTIPVAHASDKYFVYDSADFRRDNAKPRAPGTESAGTGHDLTTATYTTETYALHEDVADQIRDNADPGIDMNRDAAESVTQQLLIQKEVKWVSDYFDTGIWDTNVVGATDFTRWDDGSSDPETDIDTGRATILQNTGFEPNTLVVNYNTHQALKRHPLVTERFKHTSSDSITEALLARFFEVDRYIVAKASYTTSEEGAASETNAFIAGKNALLCYVTPTPGIRTLSAGYTFAWRGLGRSVNGLRIKNFRMEPLESDRIEGEFAYDHKVVASAAGYFFSSTVA